MTVIQPTIGSTLPKRPSVFQRAWESFSIVFDSTVGTVGVVMVAFWLLTAMLSLVWTPYPANATDFIQNESPTLAHPLGTDHLGRDTLSRLMVGTQVILVKTRLPDELFGYSLPFGDWPMPIGVAIWGVLGSLTLGSVLGLMAGYRGGWNDTIIMQILDALIAFPRIVLYLVVISAMGQGDLVVILAITITGAPGVARLVRSLAMDIKTRDYIRAAETRGESVWYIMFWEILPNARGPLLVDGMLRVGYAIFAIGTLGFLGIGLPPPDPDWGNMVNEARPFIFVTPWPVIWPSIAIASLVIGLNLFADGYREELTRYQK
ncbi:ABC transporter permease [Anaerolineales bacterium HSG6]|nr:ABC transporter permease [Anaerolineales bacterium HSG6]MDM8530333.1 ABC transporter permease [Anaerolineales bacterium HSG25]